ncbi:LysM peptidoglycan-binding domain-containing protein [Paenarthrobacter sp. NPDC057355]|uniref:LysM peptidoglycan-binding domain-containing protein n=1 Tax=Paenarthrobacter sp. NPDC057355 TaxID=3346105 RepID=UPI00362FB93A
MARSLRRDTGLAVTILGLGLLLALMGNTLVSQLENAQRHNQNFAFDLLAGFAASTAGTAIVAWWALSVTVAFVAALLHRSGASKLAKTLSRYSPAFMVRLAAAVLGINLLGGGLAHADVAPTPEWLPTSTHSSTLLRAAAPPSANGSSLSLTDGESPANTAPDPSWRPKPPVIAPGLLSRPGTREAPAAGGSGVEVKAGDTLWSIAAAGLAPFSTDVDVAMAWPKWYAANRSIIGADPSVLIPGQILHPPEPA